ncbi:MAG: mechanosensitive ion channel [Clostridia bacterium]|nr:mechanosensitive ion channel [Clostridia bacterium]
MHLVLYKYFEAQNFGWSDELLWSFSYGMALIGIALLAFIAYKFTKHYIVQIIDHIVKRSKNQFDDLLQEKRVFSSLSFIAPALVVHLFSSSFGRFEALVGQLLYGLVVAIVVLTIFRGIDVVVQMYNQYAFAKGRPIKGIMQIVKIIIACFGFGMIIVVFVGDTTATVLLGSIGGLSAVVMLIFRDSILGFVAGVQLSTGQLLSIGDWLEMPKYDADGEVVDISLTKITVRNWDKTYTSIPAHKFLEDSFKNWEGMTKSGGRRIKRAILIDVGTIGFLSPAQIEALQEIDLIRPYLKGKVSEIEDHNRSIGVDGRVLANGRRLTNIGTLRMYILEYLKHNPNIHSEGFTLMVRQLPITETGVPLEIYCFSKDINWVNYESIQADIFDHVLAVIPMFGLRVFQQPSGSDFKTVIK